jgi:2'-5' RNA ligase
VRVFAAVPMPDGVVEAVEEWMAPLRRRHPGPRWVTADRLHMTLRFLGDVGRERAEELAEALQAYGGGPVQFRLERVGRFRKGRHGPARVLWIGGSFEDGMEELARLAGRVPDERGRRERRRFIPHLTVARSRRRRGAIPEDLPPFGPVDGIADRAVVYNSRLTPEGPEYSILRSLRL